MTKHFTRILVPVDFSAHSNVALQYAVSIGERFSSDLLVLHVIAKEVELHAMHQQLGHRSVPLLGPFSETSEVPRRCCPSLSLRERAR
jgi:nucleotide-binding universal stress UspA family protein